MYCCEIAVALKMPAGFERKRLVSPSDRPARVLESVSEMLAMPWTVLLETKNAESTGPEYAVIEFETIPYGAELKLLRNLDPYSDTYFDQSQMGDFLADWEKLAPSAEQREQWQVVRNMAVRCQHANDLCLRFVGD